MTIKQIFYIGLLLSILFFGTLGVGIYYAVNYVSHHGVQNIVEQVWKGDGK